MARRRYRQINGELVEITGNEPHAPRGLTIVRDIEPFKSPVDGSVVTGRAGLRAHNKRNNVTFADDFKDHWAEKRKERDVFFSTDKTSKQDRHDRIEAIKQAIEVHR